MQPQSNTNSFFGIRISQPGINVQQANPKQLLYQSDYSTETWYDTSGNAVLNVGSIGTVSSPDYGMALLDTSGNQIVTLDSSGLTAGGGSVVLNSSGLTISSSTSTNSVSISNTVSQYSLNGTPQLLVGILPDGTVGVVQSISGVNVNNIFS